MNTYPSLKQFVRLYNFLETAWFVWLLRRLYGVRFFATRIDATLEGLILARFPYGDVFKYYQNDFMLSVAPKGEPWRYTIKTRYAKAILNSNYTFETILEGATCHLLRMYKHGDK